MSQSIRDQMLGIGLVKQSETPEARRAAVNAARPPAPEKALPPPFEAAARGVVVEKRARAVAEETCVDCGARLQSSQRTMAGAGTHRCSECAAEKP